MRVLDGIRDWLNQKSGVAMVADDPQLASEILLLLRTMFIDGSLSPEELALFKKLCKSVFNIEEEDVPDVIRFLKDYGYETTGEQAAAMFSELDEDRKRELMVHLVSMARADGIIHEQEVDLIERVGRVLGYSSQEVRAWL